MGGEAGFLLAFVLSPAASWFFAAWLAGELPKQTKWFFVGEVGLVVGVGVVFGGCFCPKKFSETPGGGVGGVVGVGVGDGLVFLLSASR